VTLEDVLVCDRVARAGGVGVGMPVAVAPFFSFLFFAFAIVEGKKGVGSLLLSLVGFRVLSFFLVPRNYPFC
jgi:hypothetical protein